MLEPYDVHGVVASSYIRPARISSARLSDHAPLILDFKVEPIEMTSLIRKPDR